MRILQATLPAKFPREKRDSGPSARLPGLKGETWATPPTHGFEYMEALNSRLLGRQRPDDGYLEGLALIGGIHQIPPQAESTDRDRQVDRQLDNEEQAVRNGAQRKPHDGPHDPERNPRHVEEDRLESVKADEPIGLEGVDHQEQNSRDEARQIGQRSSNIGGESCS